MGIFPLLTATLFSSICFNLIRVIVDGAFDFGTKVINASDWLKSISFDSSSFKNPSAKSSCVVLANLAILYESIL